MDHCRHDCCIRETGETTGAAASHTEREREGATKRGRERVGERRGLWEWLGGGVHLPLFTHYYNISAGCDGTDVRWHAMKINRAERCEREVFVTDTCICQ